MRRGVIVGMTSFDPELDAPDSKLQAMLLKPPSQWTEDERKRFAARLAAERELHVDPSSPKSILYRGSTQGQTVLEPRPFGSADTPKLTDETGGRPLPDGTSTDRPVYRGGSKAFQDTQDQFSRTLQGINDGTIPYDPSRTSHTPRPAPNIQNPGADYRPNLPEVALTPAERAGGAAATTPLTGTPGNYSPGNLPPGFSSYTNADGGITITGPDNKPQKFANAADATAFLNRSSQPAQPSALVVNRPTPEPSTQATPEYTYPIYSLAGIGERAYQGALALPNTLNNVGRGGGALVNGILTGDYTVAPPEQGIVSRVSHALFSPFANDFPAAPTGPAPTPLSIASTPNVSAPPRPRPPVQPPTPRPAPTTFMPATPATPRPNVFPTGQFGPTVQRQFNRDVGQPSVPSLTNLTPPLASSLPASRLAPKQVANDFASRYDPFKTDVMSY